MFHEWHGSKHYYRHTKAGREIPPLLLPRHLSSIGGRNKKEPIFKRQHKREKAECVEERPQLSFSVLFTTSIMGASDVCDVDSTGKWSIWHTNEARTKTREEPKGQKWMGFARMNVDNLLCRPLYSSTAQPLLLFSRIPRPRSSQLSIYRDIHNGQTSLVVHSNIRPAPAVNNRALSDRQT